MLPGCFERLTRVSLFGCRSFWGGNGGGVTPLPIPNREVKPSRADGTARETGWESRSPPLFSSRPRHVVGASRFRGLARAGASSPARCCTAAASPALSGPCSLARGVPGGASPRDESARTVLREGANALIRFGIAHTVLPCNGPARRLLPLGSVPWPPGQGAPWRAPVAGANPS